MLPQNLARKRHFSAQVQGSVRPTTQILVDSLQLGRVEPRFFGWPASDKLMVSARRVADTRWGSCYCLLMLIGVFCVVWAMVTAFVPQPVGSLDASTGTLCPRDTVCAETWYALLLLAISRSGAYFCYPMIFVVFLSKANNLRTYLQRSCLSMFVPFHDLHQLHVLTGKVIGMNMAIHSLCHMIRWGVQGNISFLWSHVTGWTGLVCIILLPLIVLPMALDSLRRRMSWELRKGLHYLSVVWGFVICFHAPATSIAILVGVPLGIYVVDYLWGSFMRTYKIETSCFTRIECGVELTFRQPRGFLTGIGGYVLVCVPWLSRWQWHPFSIYQHPVRKDHHCVCILACGGWTDRLHQLVKQQTVRPVWISGPFSSPYSTAVDFDNLILVATGIGITPALSIIETHKHTRRVNLIWICRDAALVEFYLQNVKFEEEGWTMVFYTGKRKLALAETLPRPVLVFCGRPPLEPLVYQIIIGIESGDGLPEQLLSESNAYASTIREYSSQLHQNITSTMDIFSGLLQRALKTYTTDEFMALTVLSDGTIKERSFVSALHSIMPNVLHVDEIEELLHHFVSDSGDGTIDHSKLSAFCQTALRGSYTDAVAASTPHRSLFELANDMPRSELTSVEAVAPEAVGQAEGQAPTTYQAFCTAIGGAQRLKTWQILYCGGSKKVTDVLQKMSSRHGLFFKKEKFDW